MEVTIGEKVYVISETLEAEELAPIFSDTWTGSRVWEASCFLSRCLLDFHRTQRHRFLQAQSSKVIELGSGCGLAGLVAADLGGTVVMTDQLEVVELIKRNISFNASKESAERVEVCEFLWGSDVSSLPYPKYDYILISDCINPIYGADSWRNLARSIQVLSRASTITYLSHEKRGNDEAMIDFQQFSEEFLVHECIDRSEKKKLSLCCLAFASNEQNFIQFQGSKCIGRIFIEHGHYDAMENMINMHASLAQEIATMDQGAVESVGIFWGKPRNAHSRQKNKKNRNKGINPTSPVKMPQISAGSSSISLRNRQNTVGNYTQKLPPPCSAEIKDPPLLAVLKTLLTGIQMDIQRFMSSHGPLEFPSQVPPGKYYTTGVEKEHMEYFVHQRSLQAARDTYNTAIVWARKTHCATDQNQRYCFDRRTVQQQNKLSNSSSANSFGTGPSKKSPTRNIAMENTLIKRNTQKIEHLIYILQEEISKETAREIRYLDCWTPARAVSRQSQRKIGNLVKERYEAADRIMRILEDYKIIGGVEAAAYLKRTIDEGKANGHLT